MFSSIAKYTNPKQLLASYLSKSLAEFFNVDPAKVETNLIRDAKVGLNQIEIKERRIGRRLLVSGSVDRIEFSWVWDTHSWITDVKLTIFGVRIHVNLVVDEDHDEDTPETTTTTTVENAPAATEGDTTDPGWKARYLRQILDHLTLIVRDVEIILHLNETSQVILQSKDMELKTVSEHVNDGDGDGKYLMQVMSVASLEVFMNDSDSNGSNNKYPILEPFGYQANVQRVSGRRFLDGILEGLFIQGHHNVNRFGESQQPAPSSIRVHAGVRQIAGLSRLQEVLLSVGSEDDTTTTTTEMVERHSALEKQSETSLLEETKKKGINSVFRLPIQSMEVVLENQTTLRLSGCTIRYCTDGSELSVDCTDGIWMDELPLSKNNRWLLDLVASELSLESLGKEEIFFDANSTSDTNSGGGEEEHLQQMFLLELSLDMFQNIYDGVQAIVPQCVQAMDVAEKAMKGGTVASAAAASSSSSPPWVFKVNGSLTFRFNGKDNIGVQVTVESPMLKQGDASCPFYLDCRSICLESTANSEFLVKVPEIQTKDGCIFVQDRITATVGSVGAISSLQNLFGQVMEVIGATQSTPTMDSPIDLQVPQLEILVKKPAQSSSSTIKVSGIQGSGSIWKVQSILADGFGGVEFEADSLIASLQTGKTSLWVETIPKLSIANVGRLEKVTSGLSVVLENNKKASIECNMIHFECPNFFSGMSSKNTTSTIDEERNFLLIPVAVQCSFKRFIVMPEFGAGKPGICFDGLRLDATPDSQTAMVTLGASCHFFQGRSPDQSELTAKGVKVHTTIDTSNMPAVSNMKLKVRVEEIQKLRIPGVLDITKPLLAPVLAFEDGWATVTCGVINLSFLETEQPSIQETLLSQQTNENQVNIPVPIRLVARQLCVQSSVALTGFDYSLQCEKVHVEVIPPSKTTSVSLRWMCESLRAASGIANLASISGLTVSTKWQGFPFDKNDATPLPESLFYVPGLGHLVFASIDVDVCSELNVEGHGHLLKPIQKSRMCFHENSLSVNLDEIHMKAIVGSNESPVHRVKKLEASGGLLEMPIIINLKHLKVETCSGAKHSTALLGNINLDLRPTSTKCEKSIHIRCKSLAFCDKESNKFAGKGASLQLLLVCAEETTPKPDQKEVFGVFDVPGLGSLKKGLFKLDEVSCVNLAGAGRLVQPALNSTISFENKVVSACLETIYLEGFSNAQKASIEAGTTKATLEQMYGFSFGLSVARMVIISGARVGAPGVTLEPLHLEVKAPGETGQSSISFDCSTLQAVGATSMGFAMSGIDGVVQLKLFYNQAPRSVNFDVPGCGTITDAVMKVSSISKLVIPGIGSLGREVRNTAFVFENDSLFCSFDKIDWKLYTVDESTSTVANDETSVFMMPKLPVKLTVATFRIEDACNYVLCSSELSVSLQPDPFDASFRMTAQSKVFQGETSSGSSATIDRVNLSALFTQLNPTDKLKMVKFSVPAIGHLSMMTINIDEVPKCRIPGVGSLSAPMKKMVVRFENDVVSIHCPSISMLQEHSQLSVAANGSTPFELPCSLKVLVQEASLEAFLPAGKVKRRIECRLLDLTLDPVLAQVASSAAGPGAGFFFKCFDFESVEDTTIVRIPNTSASGLVQFDKMDSVGNLVVGVARVELTSNFSSVNWTAPLDPISKPSETLKFPFAIVQKFDLTLRYAGKLFNIKEATVSCETFEGDIVTDLGSLQNHYVKIVKGRIPYLLARTELVGANVGDSLTMVAGTVAMGSSIIGATVGVAGRDAIGGALTKGKSTRGASSTEKYKFGEYFLSLSFGRNQSWLLTFVSFLSVGDFTRGVVASVKDAASSGSQMRGGDTYAVGDFSAGASKAAGEYTSKNRVRLAGAGGSAVSW